MKKFVLLMVLVFAFPAFGHDENHHHEMEAEEEKAENNLSGDSIYNSQGIWTNMNGEKKSLASLKGKPQVIAMVYTSCQFACPIITADMKRIEKNLPEKIRSKVGFDLFSFDPKRDTPETLKKYLVKKDLNPSQWELFTSDEKSVRELAAVLGVKYKKLKNDFSHSNIIFVLDEEGVVRYQQVGLNKNPEETVNAIKNILHAK